MNRMPFQVCCCMHYITISIVPVRSELYKELGMSRVVGKGHIHSDIIVAGYFENHCGKHINIHVGVTSKKS